MEKGLKKFLKKKIKNPMQRNGLREKGKEIRPQGNVETVIRLSDLILEKKLRVFDFDDTLVKSNSKVYVNNKGKKTTLTLAVPYKKKSGDEFDFSDFDKVIEPKKIKSMFKVFNNIYRVEVEG